MGSSPSTISEQFDFTSVNIIPESRENRRVIVQHKPVEVRDVTGFTGRAFSLSNKRTDIFTLAIQGGGVVRICLTDEDPMTNEEFYKNPVFEQEDGFESGESSRCLFYDKMIDMFCYGRKDEHIEFSPIRKFRERSMYLYVIFIYGRPTVSVVHGKDNIDLTHYQGSNVENILDKGVSLKTAKNVSMMKIRKRVDFTSGYHLHWDMGLSQENIGRKIPKFGYLRLGLSSASVENHQIQTYSINTFDTTDHKSVWFTESAVAEFPYSGTIAFKISPQYISHNVMAMSVGKTKVEKIITNPVQILIEASSGTFTMERSVHYTVKQYAGTRLLVKDYDEFENSTATKFKVSTVVNHEPYHIQYGPNPRSFMVMFNKRFTRTDTVVFRNAFRISRELEDTDMVQALYKEGTLDKNSVEEAFSRHQLVGGGEILSVKPSDELQRCWLIKYKNEEDAERVWMRRAIVVEGVSVTILPWYEELGVAANFGEKPVFDDTDLVISGLDQVKMSFIAENNEQRVLLKQYICKEIPVVIQWPESDDYERSDIEEIKLTIGCQVTQCSHVKRAQWKQTVSEMVESYIEKKIHMHTNTVEENYYDKILDMLNQNNQTQQKCFKFMAKRARLKFTIITNDGDLAGKLQEQIQEIQKLAIDKITTTIERDNVEMYHALDAEGVLDRIRRECPNTRFVVSDDGVKLSGPTDEVQEAEKNILDLVVSTTTIQVGVSPGLKNVLESQKGKMSLAKTLQRNGLCERFKVEGEFCKLWIYQENSKAVERKTDIFEQALRDNYFEKAFTVKAEMIKNMQRISSEELIRQLDLGNHVNVVVDLKNAVIRICGMEEELQKIERRLQKFLTEVSQSKKYVPVMLSLDAIEYIHTWDDKLTTAPYSVQKRDDEPFGLVIAASESDMKKLEEEVLMVAGKIKSFWFYIIRPWLAFERDQVKDAVDSFCNDLQCNVDIATSSRLAHDKISSVAIEKKSGTICLSISCDIFKSKVDAIIIPTEDPELKLSTGFAKNAGDEGGRSLINECNKYVKDNGVLKPFDTVMFGSGNMFCQAVILVYVPTSDMRADSSMMYAITACLKEAQSKLFVSVMIPVVHFCQTNATDRCLDAITKTIDAFVTKNSGGSLKEIGLCDIRIGIVKKVEKTMTANLKQPWFIFKHTREIKGIQVNEDNSITRPFSSRGHRTKRNSLRWRNDVYPKPNNEQTDPDDNDDDGEEAMVFPDMPVFEHNSIIRPLSRRGNRTKRKILRWHNDVYPKPNNEQTDPDDNDDDEEEAMVLPDMPVFEHTSSRVRRGIKDQQFLSTIRGQTYQRYTSEDDVMMVKLTLKGDTSDARKQFLHRIERMFDKEEVTFDLPQITTNEIRLVENIKNECRVLVQIDTSNNKILLEGLKNNVYDAGVKLNQLLRSDFPAERTAQQMREEVIRYIQWFYDDNGELKPYDAVSNFDIHFAFLEQNDFVYHNSSEDRKYQVWIQSLEEHPVTDSTRRRQMLQRQKVSNDINIPDTWIIRSNGKDREEVDLNPSLPEYDDVKQKFLRAGCPTSGIVNIKRIEDKYKYLQYMSKKKQLENQNPKRTQNELELWHGTDATTSGLIIKDGFNRSFAGKNATRYGHGVYFATSSKYSNGYALPDAGGVCRMFLSKVLVGMFCQGNGNMFVLPVRNTVKNIKICYDSAVDNTKNPGMYIIFHDTQAYPEYLIEYNR